MKKLKILFICPGGQTNLNSPSENLAKYINHHYENIQIDIFNQTYKPVKNNANGYDLVWGDMDGNNVPTIALNLSKKSNIPCYIHGEWIPPYRFEKGWSEYFNEPTKLSLKDRYIKNLNAMKEADLVSLALDKTPGGFEWVKEKTGIDFKNKFVRYPASKKYDFIDVDRKYQVATIARVNDGKKRVDHNIRALTKLDNKPHYKIIGGNVTHPNLKIESMGSFNNDNKVKIYSESLLSLQHWSGIPPAESIQQLCPVISYDIPYMKELYGDGLIWVKKDDINDLSEKIEYWISHEKERNEFAEYSKENFINGKYGVKLEKHRAELVVNNILKII